MATLDISPSRVRRSQTRTVTFIGSGTTWQSVAAPTFSVTGVSGISAGSVTVLSDTVATCPITYGTSIGVCTWTDSTTSATHTQAVQNVVVPRWIPGL